jgi:transcriptional regulator GlxA family with amidase domain
MSVCTGALALGDVEMLKGSKTTTHHLNYDEFHTASPEVLLRQDKPFAETDAVILTAGGLNSGINHALNVVQLQGGADLAEETAKLLEPEGTGWKCDRTDPKPDVSKLELP